MRDVAETSMEENGANQYSILSQSLVLGRQDVNGRIETAGELALAPKIEIQGEHTSVAFQQTE
jgi:hypothetical protein